MATVQNKNKDEEKKHGSIFLRIIERKKENTPYEIIGTKKHIDKTTQERIPTTNLKSRWYWHSNR